MPWPLELVPSRRNPRCARVCGWRELPNKSAPIFLSECSARALQRNLQRRRIGKDADLSRAVIMPTFCRPCFSVHPAPASSSSTL
eukprot:9499407-Pyramimonas_sp.AAC.2